MRLTTTRLTPEMAFLDELARFAGVGREYRVSVGSLRGQAAAELVRLGYAVRTRRGIAMTQAGERRGREIFAYGATQFFGWTRRDTDKAAATR